MCFCGVPHYSFCTVAPLEHQEGRFPQMLAVSGNSRFWTVVKGLLGDYGDAVVGEGEHSAGMLSFCHADKDLNKSFRLCLTICIACPFDIYPLYCFTVLLFLVELFQDVFSYHSYFYKLYFQRCYPVLV